MFIRNTLIASLIATMLSVSGEAAAAWTLNNDLSRLSFVSIKATDIGEVHKFTQLSGGITDGKVSVSINLASVDTLIPIRDERMQKVLFETEIFPSAEISAAINQKTLEELAAGSVATLAVEANLALKGQTVPLTAQLLAVRAAENKVVIASLQPVLLTAAATGLSDGVEKLREIAGLPNISQAVPVSFVLTFEQTE